MVLDVKHAHIRKIKCQQMMQHEPTKRKQHHSVRSVKMKYTVPEYIHAHACNAITPFSHYNTIPFLLQKGTLPG